MFSSNYFLIIIVKQLIINVIHISISQIKLKNCKGFEMHDIFFTFGRSTILRNSEPQIIF